MEDPAYIASWVHYRKWGRLRLVAMLGYLPFGAFVARLSKLMGLHEEALLLMLPWFAFVMIALIKAGGLRCPRCDKPFFYTWYWSNPLASKCVRCGLPKWATEGASATG